MGLVGWSWAREESPLKQASMEIMASGHSCFIQCQKASKGGETGRRESRIGHFGNPFLKETQRLVQLEWGEGSSALGCSVGGLGKPLPHRAGGRQLPHPAGMATSASPGHPTSRLLPEQRRAGPGVGEGQTQQLLSRRGVGGAVPQPLLLLALPAVPVFITGVVPFRQISSLVLDFYQVMARLRCPCTLPWVSHAPISTQDLVPAWDDVADGL